MSKRKKAPPIDESTKHRKQSESWNPDRGYGADYIKWINKPTESIDSTRDVIDLTDDTVDVLNAKYKKEFPKGTPLVCACEKGRLEDVKVLIKGHGMTLKEYVNKEGTNSWYAKYTPLIIAAEKEHFQIVKYLIEECEADPNIVNSYGWNALHCAAANNKKNTELIELLLTHMTLDSINMKDRDGATPLDEAYIYNRSPIRQEVIALLRSKGGKANCHDENGRDVGAGNGDLNKHGNKLRDVCIKIKF